MPRFIWGRNKMGKDVYGHTYIYENGEESPKPQGGLELILSYYYVENEGWSFLKRGAERRIEIHFPKRVNPQKVRQFLEKHKNEDEEVYIVINELMKKNRLVSGCYQIKEGKII